MVDQCVEIFHVKFKRTQECGLLLCWVLQVRSFYPLGQHTLLLHVTEYRMRRILDGGSYRLVVLVDPTGPAKQNEGLKSQTVVLDCSISGFTMSG